MTNTPSAQIISLPQGGGALSGIGEKFSPDLFTGTGNFTVPIALPPGRNGFQPQLNLVYSTGNGNGLFGLGWDLSIPGVSRKISDGVPRYNESAEKLRQGERRDVFILSGAEDLVRAAGNYPGEVTYRPRTEGLFAQIIHHHTAKTNFWQVKSKDGLVSFYGTPTPDRLPTNWFDPAVIRKPGSGAIYAWKLTETRDLFGNRIVYDYDSRDSGDKDGHHWDQPLLTRIRYADYGNPADQKFLVAIAFEYDDRPDPFSTYRPGFELHTSKRCKAIVVTTQTEDGTVQYVRKYVFQYQPDAYNGVSLLTQLDIIGFDDAGNAYEGDYDKANPKQLPPLTFAYTAFAPEKRRFEIVRGRDLPTRALNAPEIELVDLHGSGLPDILEMNGAVRYWRNRGNGCFDLPRPMSAAPAHTLADPSVQLIDANGDGRMDLLVSSGLLAGYYPLTHKAAWDRKSFQPYKQHPSFSFSDPEVRLVDLTGDGVTDLIRSGARLECFFNDPREGWLPENTRWVERQLLPDFPNVNFSDPRVRLADMTGDGLQDIVLIHDGNVEYWPNLGHGDWGKRISMRHSPRFPFGYDPKRILLGDVDGDGLADLIYVDNHQVKLWVNHSGDAWRSDPVIVLGTPPITDLDDLRLVDLNGTGVSGILWSSDATISRDRLRFLDFTGGRKPYVLNEMNNHMGAITCVEYRPSTFYYLEDAKKPSTRWRTPLPFPVQVVARVEVIDAVSRGKLTSEYRYHHGYWDGAEREFRGFGMVEQRDTETLADYHTGGLHDDPNGFEPVTEKQFSLPTLTKSWFHQGPVGEEFGDWVEADYTDEYWPDDPQLLDHKGKIDQFLRTYNDRPGGAAASPSNRRIKRNALRALRGSLLRSETYALDGSPRASRPFSVIEQAYQLKPVDVEDERRRVFFPHLVAQRVSQWERGEDPQTQFSFTEYDAYGQPIAQTTTAMPRRSAKRRVIAPGLDLQPDETRILASHSRTVYAAPSGEIYLYNRVAQTQLYEFATPPELVEADPALPAILRQQAVEAEGIHQKFLANNGMHLIGHTLNYYDGLAFEGLALGQSGVYGALTRTQTLIMRDEELDAAYADGGTNRRPAYLGGAALAPGGAPPDFGDNLGYRREAAGGVEGYYADVQRNAYDFQIGAANPRGLVVALKDTLGNETRIGEYACQLLPVRMRDAANMETSATYNYRVLQPASLTDPNWTTTCLRYSPIGLPVAQYIQKGDEGGTAEKPEIRFDYDFCRFDVFELPVYVQTTRRIQHASVALSDETIISREYSDGYGRLIQTRAQAEEWIFGESGDDVGLSAEPGGATAPAVAHRSSDSVIVSGWQIFDNKGRVVAKYEPFFAQGLDFQPEAAYGQRVEMFYEPRGNLIRTLNPDGSQQRIILGCPQNPLELVLDAADLELLDAPKGFEPTPWESYTYDANDLAPLCDKDGNWLIGRAPVRHYFTPVSAIRDGLGRTLCQIERNGKTPADDWFITRTQYDLRGNVLNVMDALGRAAFKHAYDLLNRPLRVESMDAGLRTSVLDAQGNLMETRDSKGSLRWRTYDNLNRPKEIWARDDSAGRLTLRERIRYGDEGDHALARARNALGKPTRYYDEAGLLETPAYDFKGNLLQKSRRTIRDEALASGWQADWSKDDAEAALEGTAHQTDVRYDALNRPQEITYPEDVEARRRKLVPRYNRAGALEAVALDGNDYVRRIAYNARRQRVLIVYGSNVMTRHAYDPLTFRLARLRTERVRSPGPLAWLSGLFAGEPDTLTFETSGNPVQDFAYTYDLTGNITTIDERVPNCGIQDQPDGRNRLLREFTYDPLYRLLSATGRACKGSLTPRGLDDDPRCGFHSAGGAPDVNQENAPNLTESYSETYAYDLAGNMLKLSYYAASGSWTRLFGLGNLPNERWREAPNNRLTSLKNGEVAPAHTYQFDANGNLTRQNSERQHTWDHADHMTGYTVSAGGPASIEARYLYGADGMRVKKWVRKGSRVQTTTYIDGIFERHTRSGPDSAAQNNSLHIMDNQSRIAILRIGPHLEPADISPRVQYHFGDHLGGSHVVLGGNDAGGDGFINREEYFPYGETSFGSFAKKRYRYSGKEKDEESGLVYFGARYLAPWLARWVSCDPAGMMDDVNLYLFARSCPICFVDRYGFTSDDPPKGTEPGKDVVLHQPSEVVSVPPASEETSTGGVIGWFSKISSSKLGRILYLVGMLKGEVKNDGNWEDINPEDLETEEVKAVEKINEATVKASDQKAKARMKVGLVDPPTPPEPPRFQLTFPDRTSSSDVRGYLPSKASPESLVPVPEGSSTSPKLTEPQLGRTGSNLGTAANGAVLVVNLANFCLELDEVRDKEQYQGKKGSTKEYLGHAALGILGGSVAIALGAPLLIGLSPVFIFAGEFALGTYGAFLSQEVGNSAGVDANHPSGLKHGST